MRPRSCGSATTCTAGRAWTRAIRCPASPPWSGPGPVHRRHRLPLDQLGAGCEHVHRSDRRTSARCATSCAATSPACCRPPSAQAMLTERFGPIYRDVVRRMGRDGWLGVGWPEGYGGRGFGQVEQQIFVNEAARADVPLPAVTLQTVGPDAADPRHGGAEGLLPAEDPGRGGALRDRVHRAGGRHRPGLPADPGGAGDGQEYVVNGQKIFTTGGHDADYIWLACRTDPDAPRHRGISILIVDTRDPGYSWTPIITHDGAHHVNVTYYDGVRVPVSMRVGEENAGWRLVTEQLNHERVMIGPAGRLAALHDRVRAWAAGRGPCWSSRMSGGRWPAPRPACGSTSCSTGRSRRGAGRHRRRLGHQGLLIRAGAGHRPGAGGDRRPSRRPADPETAELMTVAGRPAQAQHRADVRRRGQRDPA